MTQAIAIIPAADSAARLNQVVDWIVSGATEGEITAAIKTTWPDAKARPMIAAAMRRIVRDADADPSVVNSWCVEACRHVYKQALAAGDFGSSLRAIRQLRDLIGGE